MTLRELLNDAAGRSEQEIFNLARNATNKLYGFLQEEEGFEEKDMANLLAILFKLFVSADRKTRTPEYKLFLALLGLSPSDFSQDDFFELTDCGANDDFVRHTLDLIHSLPEEYKFACGYIGVAVIACDREVTDAEEELLCRVVG